MKQIVSLIAVLSLAGALCACNNNTQDTGSGWDLSSMPEVTAPEIQIPSMSVPTSGEDESKTADTQAPAVPDGAIADASGSFVYTGKVDQVGDDENGYIKVPLGFVRFQDADVNGMLQYSDTSGTNIISLDYYQGSDFSTIAESMRAYLEAQDGVEGISGARTTVNGYEAYQVYGHFPDGFFLVSWAIQDPADPDSSYYLSMEFDQAHQDMVACSSTFQTVKDYQAATE